MAASKKPLLLLEPSDKIRFSSDADNEITATLSITNKSETKQAYKVKCTSNELFRIAGATGILGYNQSITIFFRFRGNAENLPDVEKLFFGVYHIPAPEGCTCESVWAEHWGAAQGEYRMGVVFEDKK